jgi:peptidoglycan/xylan/chitin deacetylase (PgdA/CDA1 family)
MGNLSDSDRDSSAIYEVRRRRLLLAVGGITLTGIVGSRWLSAPGHLPPHREVSAYQKPAAQKPAAQRSPVTHHAPVKHPDPRAYHPASYPLDRPLYYIDDASKAIALTIDDGPDPVYTPQVLGVLHRYGVTATFSMVGLHVAAYPHLARSVTEAGHHIANHTWTHSNLARVPVHRVHTELAWTSHAIHSATGVHPKLFRAPYGAWSATVIRQCDRMRMVPMDWSVDPRDWARPGVRSIVRNIMHHTHPGSIILEHDGGGNRSQTVDALKIVLPRLLREGYQFQTV